MHIKVLSPGQVNRVCGYEVKILKRTEEKVEASVRKIDSKEMSGYGIYFAAQPGDSIGLEGGTVKVVGLSDKPQSASEERSVLFESTTPQGAEKFSLAPVTQKNLGFCSSGNTGSGLPARTENAS